MDKMSNKLNGIGQVWANLTVELLSNLIRCERRPHFTLKISLTVAFKEEL